MFTARINTRKSEYTVFAGSALDCKKLLKATLEKVFYKGFWKEMNYEEEFHATEIQAGQVWWDMDSIIPKGKEKGFN